MRRLLLTAAALVLLPAAAAAQKAPAMQPGIWAGTLVLPNGTSVAVKLDITAAADSTTGMITLTDAPFPALPLVEPKRTPAGKLMFGFVPEGQNIICTLEKPATAERWEGNCTADDGSTGTITLQEPKK